MLKMHLKYQLKGSCIKAHYVSVFIHTIILTILGGFIEGIIQV